MSKPQGDPPKNIKNSFSTKANTSKQNSAEQQFIRNTDAAPFLTKNLSFSAN